MLAQKKGKFLRRPKGTQKKEKKVMKILTQGGFTPAGSVSARIVCESKLIFGNTKYQASQQTHMIPRSAKMNCNRYIQI